MIASLILLVFLAVDPKLKAAEEQGRMSSEALVKGDYETLLGYTHPKVLKAMGGYEAALKRMRKEIEASEKTGLTFDSCKVEPATDLIQTGEGLFCLVPLTLKMKLQGKTISKRSALLGISSDGKDWKFVDTTPGEANLRKLLPELPRELTIPKTARPVIE